MARRGENITHRRDGRWEGRYISGRREDGRARYTSVYGHSYQEVRDKLGRRRAEQEARSLTVRQLCQRWLEGMRGTAKESSYYRYEQMVRRHIMPALGELRADALTTDVLNQFINDKLEHGRLDGKGGLSAKTVRDIVIAVKAIMAPAGQEYSQPIRPPKAEAQALSEADTRRLEQTLLAEPNNSNAGFRLCLHAGVRLGEVCALRWSDIDWDSEVLHIRRTVLRLPRHGGGPGTKTQLTLAKPQAGWSERDIPLTAELSAYLRRVARGQDADAFVLTGTTERLMDPRTYQYRFQSLLKRLNIRRVPFRGIRHTYTAMTC